MDDTPLFEETTPLGVKVRTTHKYWTRIVTFKHPVIRGKEELVRRSLREPVEIRQSRQDERVHLYYHADPPYYVCVVTKKLNGDGFVITAYRTDKIKEGVSVWPV